jgi:RNA-directed DNA polymerase
MRREFHVRFREGPGVQFPRATRLVMGFERQDDAERVMAVLKKRMGRYGLTLHPEKTRLLRFSRPPRGQPSGKGPSTFDFLGFTVYWRRTKTGRWGMACKTRSARLRRATKAVWDWCRRYRHEPIEVQHAALTRRIQGHFNYFGVNGNGRSLAALIMAAERAWYTWLRKRSQRTRLTWKRFASLLETYPLPVPRIKVQIWGT